MSFIKHLLRKEKNEDPVYQGKTISQWTFLLGGGPGFQELEAEKEAKEMLLKSGRIAVPHLIRLLKSNNTVAQSLAIEILGHIKDSRAVEPLCAILKIKKTWDIRMKAPEALGEIGDDRAVDPLIASLKQSKTLSSDYYAFKLQFYQQISKALKQIGEPALIHLIESLKKISMRSVIHDVDKEFMSDLGGILVSIGRPALNSVEEALRGQVNETARRELSYVKKIITNGAA